VSRRTRPFTPYMDPDELKRFMSHVRREGKCWVYDSRRKDGYGQVAMRGTTYRAHRLSYRYFVGEIPIGKEIDHKCRNRACVFPDHLDAVTGSENMKRIPWAVVRPRKTHCSRGHELSPDNLYTYQYRGYEQHCKACSGIQYRLRRERMGAA